MLARMKSHFRSSVVGYVALFFALGLGTAWAIETNSVRSKHIVDGQVKPKDLAPPKPWDEVGDGNGPAFSTTSTPGFCQFGKRGDNFPVDDWENFPSYQTAAFYRDAGGVVRLKGLVRRGTDVFPCEDDSFPGPISIDDIFKLPEGYSPAATAIFANRSSNAPAELRIEADGDVVAMSGDYTWVSLDGIAFRCAPSGQNGCP